MTRDEYEKRQQRLDEQLRSGIELLLAAHRRQVQALNLIWRTGDEEKGEGEVKSPLLAEQQPAPLPAPAPPRAPRRRKARELYFEVLDALDDVPEVFDRNHVCAQLGYQPDRGSLHRALQELIGEGVVRMESRGEGRTPTRYRKENSGVREADL